MKREDDEKIMMEVTKEEAMFLLADRLEDKWYVDLEVPICFYSWGSDSMVSV